VTARAVGVCYCRRDSIYMYPTMLQQ